jgi:hypothetical protein
MALPLPGRSRAIALVVTLVLAIAGDAFAEVWVADEHNLYKIGTAGIALTLPAKKVAAIAVDPDTGDVWTVDEQSLSRRADDGSFGFARDLRGLDIDDHALLALDAHDGSVWLGPARTSPGNGRALLHVDRAGAVLGSIAVTEDARGLSIALDRSLWVLGQKRLLHYAASGALLADIDLKPVTNGEPKLLLVDSLGAWIWIGAEKRLARIDVLASAAPPVSLTLPQATRALALDEAGHVIWAATSKQLLRIDASGIVLGAVELKEDGIGSVRALAFDPLSRTVLVGHEAGVTRLDALGGNASLVPTRKPVEAIGVAPFFLDTTLDLASPARGALTNDASTSIVLRMHAMCSGSDCGFASGFYGGYSLSALLNGREVGGEFTIDADSGDARYHPPARLPEGTNTLHAQATDPFGQPSEPLDAQFTIDTIAPELRDLAPASPYVTNQASVHVTGRLSEPAALVAAGRPVPVAPDGAFGFDLALTEGLNAFTLEATDPAGNKGAASLSVTLDTVAPSFLALSPAAGSTTLTNRNPLHLTGRLSETATLTVDGAAVTAGPDGTFDFERPLAEGPNVVSLVAVDAAGNSTSRTMTATLDTIPPPMPDGSRISLTPGDGSAHLAGAAASVEPDAGVRATDTNGGTTVEVRADSTGAFSLTIAAHPGDGLQVVAVDAAGNAGPALSIAIPVSSNQPPSVHIDGVEEGQPLVETDLRDVAVHATDADGSIVRLELLDNGRVVTEWDDSDYLYGTIGPFAVGAHAIVARATDDKGAVATAVVNIVVAEDPVNASFRAIWNAMNAALVAGDKATAMTYLTANAQDIYGPVFDTLMPDFPAIVASYSPLRRVAVDVDSGIAIYAINRTIDGVDRIFMIQFLTDENGTWLIDSM